MLRSDDMRRFLGTERATNGMARCGKRAMNIGRCANGMSIVQAVWYAADRGPQLPADTAAAGGAAGYTLSEQEPQGHL